MDVVMTPDLPVATPEVAIATLSQDAGRKGRKDRVRVVDFDWRWKEGVQALYAQTFGEAAAAAFASRWQWSRSTDLGQDSAPAWVLSHGQAAVGFLATVPLPYRIAGERVIAHTPCDYAVLPGYRFNGILLMRRFFEVCENCVSCDDIPATIKVTEWLGARRAGRMVRVVKILDARSLRTRRGWNRVPSPALWPLTASILLADRVRVLQAPGGGGASPAAGFDCHFDRFFQRLARTVPATVERSLAFLRWRYGAASPHAGAEVGVITSSDGELRGYIVFHCSPTVSHASCILDLQTDPPGDGGLTGALLDYAVDRLRAKGAWVVRYHFVPSAYAPPLSLLHARGFVTRGGHQMLVRFEDTDLQATAAAQANWSYSYGDSEASHAEI